MPIRTTDQPEQFQPLGGPIRQEPAKPAPQPEPVGNGLWRSADGKLETRIPPPAISPAQRQGMWQRDAGYQWLTITKQVQDLPNFQTLTDPTAIREEFAKDD